MVWVLVPMESHTGADHLYSGTPVARRVRKATGLHRSSPGRRRTVTTPVALQRSVTVKERSTGCSHIRKDIYVQPDQSQAWVRGSHPRLRSGTSRRPGRRSGRARWTSPPSLPSSSSAGTTVTNTGPSVLNGDLGVSPGTALDGFGLPAVVNGATHANDAVAAKAQLDLTIAYDVAAGQPVAPADDLSGTDLGNRKLGPGAYRYNAAALLTGALTLDAEGDPNAQFVFEIGSALTTESASSVVLDQRRVAVQRLLAGRQLGRPRHHHRLPGKPDGADLDLAEKRGDGAGQDAGPQRPGQPDQQRADPTPVRDGPDHAALRRDAGRTAPGAAADTGSPSTPEPPARRRRGPDQACSRPRGYPTAGRGIADRLGTARRRCGRHRVRPAPRASAPRSAAR